MNPKHFLIIASIIALSSSIEFSYNNRILAEQTAKDAACRNIPLDYNGVTGFNSLKEYVSSLNIPMSTGHTFLKNYLLKNTKDGLGDFYKSVIGFIIILSFSIIILLSWIILYICCCFNCCIFNDTNHMTCGLDKDTCGQCSKILAIIFIAIIIIASCIGLSYSRSFLLYYNGSLCSLLSFLDNALYGNPAIQTSKWGGIKTLDESIGLIVKNIQNLQASSDASPDLSKDILKLSKIGNAKAVADLQNLDFSINSPEDVNKMKPTYATLLTDTVSTSSYIYGILQEMKKLYENADSIIFLQDLFKEFKENTNSDEKIVEIQALFTEFSRLVSLLNEKFGGNMIKVKEKAINVLTGLFIFLFSISILISLSTIGLIICYSSCRCFSVKFILHFYWGFLCLLSIGSCIVGSLIGIIGVVGHDTIPLMSEILSPEYLKSSDSAFGETKAASYIDRCVNGNGDLEHEMGLSIFLIYSSLENYIQSSVNVALSKKAYETTAQSDKVANTKTKMIYYQLRDISSTSPSYKTSIEKINLQLETSGCTEKFFILNQAPQGKQIKAHSPFELIACGTKPAGIEDKVKKVHSSLDENDKKINDVKLQLDLIQTTYMDLLGIATAEYDKVIALTDDFTANFIKSMGEGTFNEMLNCSYLRKDLILFLDQFGVKFSSICTQIAIFSIICSIGSYLLVFFIVRILCIYSEKSLIPEMENDDCIEMQWNDVI